MKVLFFFINYNSIYKHLFIVALRKSLCACLISVSSSKYNIHVSDQHSSKF